MLPESLPERMTRGEPFELAGHLTVVADRELRLDPVLERAESLFVQTRRLSLERRLAGEVREGRAAP